MRNYDSYDAEWLYTKQAMQKKCSSIIGKRIPVRDVPEGDPSVAYTTEEPAIYIKKDSKFTEELDANKARAFQFGVFTREMLRQKVTNFSYQREVADELESYEVPIFKTICSIIEGAAIEMIAPSFIGGYLLKSLKYASKRLHDKMECIDTAETPFQEFMLALEQVVEIGILKGRFISHEARSTYYKCHTLILEATEELDSQKRVDLCLEIHNITKHLWEDEAKEQEMYSSAVETLKDILGPLSWAIGGFESSSFGFGLDGSAFDNIDYTKGGFRETIYHNIEDLSEEEQEEYRKVKEEYERLRQERLALENISDGVSISSAGSGWDREIMYIDNDDAGDLTTIYDYDPEEDEIDVKGCDFFDKLVKIELEQARREDLAASATSLKSPLDLPVISEKYTSRNYKCKNVVVNLTDRSKAVDGYNKIVMTYESQIANSVNKLKKLFAEEGEEIVYRSSGKLSLKKSMSGTVTSRLFSKKVDPKNKSNMAVELLIDESGSMDGPRIERAKNVAICLAEIFKRLGIPLYIMGFTADIDSAHAYHTHYAMWSGATEDLLKLTSIEAKKNNFDGYSIRYGSKVLEKRSENHKVMIVISDGQPACNSYRDDLGLRDTKDAIAEARNKEQTVLGVAIGADVTSLQEMYGNDFVYVLENEDLFLQIINKFTSIVKAW